MKSLRQNDVKHDRQRSSHEIERDFDIFKTEIIERNHADKNDGERCNTQSSLNIKMLLGELVETGI